MSRVLFYDCFAGISGDMNLGALIDLGVPLDYLKEELAKLHIHDEYELCAEKGIKSGITGTRAHVHLHHHHHEGHDHDHGHSHGHHHHRSFADIREMISSSGFSDEVKETSLRIFTVLAEAEAEVHGKPIDEVHFHEVGAVDSIVDIVGSAIALEYLEADSIYSSTVELGSGTVRCAHGVMPVPAPATALLSRKFASSRGGTDHEATTPTGAAFIAAMADSHHPVLSGQCIAVGVGLGHRDSERLPNILRVSLYETEEEAKSGDSGEKACVILEANIDDMTAEHLAHLTDKLFGAGAMDVWQESIAMKKGRLGTRVCALVAEGQSSALREIFFTHSTTWGMREIPVRKYELTRSIVKRESAYGNIRVKQGFLNGKLIKEKPEFEDCRRLSEENRVTVRDITDTIQREY